MDKNAIKKYAVWARNELISRVAQKADQYGITEAEIISASEDSIYGRLLTPAEKKQRTALIDRINVKGYKQVIEEVAYTWFNRLTAIRFMEVNGYLPSHVRVFTDEENRFAPQILAEAIHLEMPGLNMDKVFELKQANKTEELYKYLIITQCNALNEILPGMFQKIEDYTELLLPDNLLREGSVIEQMISLIPEEDWTDQVQIIGWLYQYYNSEPKDLVFERLKKNIKITKENIPAATQIFTPDWIVRYMVENSLGRLWVEGHPNDELKANWKYYLEEAEQEDSVKAQLETIRREYADIKPEEIKVIDPCMGSGHILCYMFDVLVQIYEAYGYTARDAVASIVENNIYGLDIDDRAAQLSYFAVMMKARQYDRRFFSRHCHPNIVSIVESNNISVDSIDYFVNNNPTIKQELNKIIAQLKDAKEYGSAIQIQSINFEVLDRRIDEILDDVSIFRQHTIEELFPLIKTAKTLSLKFDVVVTNPPYMGTGGMGDKLSSYLKVAYPLSKTDLFAVMMERCEAFTKPNHYLALITQQSWMFLDSFEKLRTKMFSSLTLSSMLHLGSGAFPGMVGAVTTAYVARTGSFEKFKATYLRLVDYAEEDEKNENSKNPKESDLYFAAKDKFICIPKKPIAYWISPQFAELFSKESIGKYAISDGQTKTGDNDKYLRNIWEVPSTKIGGLGSKWVIHVKGGGYRKWYGNIDTVINWSPEARNHYRKDHVARIAPEYVWFRKGLSWTLIADRLSVRYLPETATFNLASPSIFFDDESMITPIIGYLNTKIAQQIIRVVNPTINTNIGDICMQPVDYLGMPERTIITELSEQNIQLAKKDWDSFETSWDFQRHPLCPSSSSRKEQELSQFVQTRMAKFGLISWHYENWEGICADRFAQLKNNEEELNRIFNTLYGLQDEISCEVDEKDISIRKADLARDIRSFISYAVGCMFGRYSLDIDGIAYAGGEWDDSKYITFRADKDNVLPICDDEYFEDDIVGKFVKFVEVVYGSATLEENLKYIAEALGGKGSPRDIIRSYFLNDFYADHLKVYQKRPIYWQFDSGKKNGFKCLIYMHRYQPDTIARIRTDYVHEQQARYRTAIADLEQRIQVATTSERVKLSKQLQKLKDQETEIRLFEEKVHHLADQMIRIDLDDGVKHNYEIFKDVLTKIK